jgi:hypothetical protein
MRGFVVIATAFAVTAMACGARDELADVGTPVTIDAGVATSALDGAVRGPQADAAAEASPGADASPETCVAAGGTCAVDIGPSGKSPCARIGPQDCGLQTPAGPAVCCLPP